MTYPISFRRKALSLINDGKTKREVCRLLKISPQTLYSWLNRPDLAPNEPKQRHRKVDKAALRVHVEENPHLMLKERAEAFNISIGGMSWLLKSMNIIKKTRNDI